MNSISSLKSLASVLSGAWSFVPRVYAGETSSDYADLRRADGLTLGLSVNQYSNKDKVIVYMHAMKDARGERITLWAQSPASGQISLPSIKVSETKTVEQIASDITRRLLPDAEAYFARASEIVKEHNAYHDAKLATLQEVCASVGAPVPTRSDNDEPRYTLAVGDHERIGYGDIVIHSADSVEINLSSMSKANALKVIEVLRSIGAFDTDHARMRNG